MENLNAAWLQNRRTSPLSLKSTPSILFPTQEPAEGVLDVGPAASELLDARGEAFDLVAFGFGELAELV